MQTAVGFLFLTTRVRDPYEDDWKKLRPLLQYVKGKIRLALTLSRGSVNVVKWWVDASYTAHHDMRGHTGKTMSIGQFSIISMSTKQNLNTKSSNESKLVGADDVLSQILWTQYFLEVQGYGINENFMYQDNLSAIILDKNGKNSITKKTKHISMQYFFIKDRIACDDISVEHCPTKQMSVDHFTKPLQGELFRNFRDELMNIHDDMKMNDLGWEGVDEPKGLTWKLHGKTNPACPYIPVLYECVGEYEGTTVSEVTPPSEVLYLSGKHIYKQGN